MLVPEAFGGRATPEIMLALEPSGPRIAGAAGYFLEKEQLFLRGFRVLRTHRRQGIGTALLNRVLESAHARQGRTVNVGIDAKAQPEAVRFLIANGFTCLSRLHIFEADLEPMRAAMQKLIEKARRSGRLLASARIVHPSAAPAGELARIYEEEILVHRRMHPMLVEASLTDDRFEYPSSVLLVDGHVAAMLIACYDLEHQRALVSARGVVQEFRGSVANAWVMADALERGQAAGVARIRFESLDDNNDTLKLAKKFRADTIHIYERFGRRIPAAGSAPGRGKAAGDPVLPPDLVERVLAKLGFKDRPALSLDGLNRLCAALCGSIPFDNVRQRIWLEGDRKLPAPGGDPIEFFENWLRHGTGGTCWPLNGGACALARALGFHARRIAGFVVGPRYPHGSLLVDLDGVEYLLDLAFGGFQVLPRMPGRRASTGAGINDFSAEPLESGIYEIRFRLGWTSTHLKFRTEPACEPVNHAFFLARYDESTGFGIFRDSLLAMRRFAGSIVTIGRRNMIVLSADESSSKTQLNVVQRNEILVGRLGYSEEIVARIPPDHEGGIALL